MSDKFDRLEGSPPPMFLGQQERDLVKHINNEVIECIIGQQIVYYPISDEHTNYHPLYGESMHKTFLDPVHVYALVEWEGIQISSESRGIDKFSTITVYFHKRRLTEDQELFVREGDFIQYGANFYEIVSVNEPREIWGQTEHKMEISAKCHKARDGLFNSD